MMMGEIQISKKMLGELIQHVQSIPHFASNVKDTTKRINTYSNDLLFENLIKLLSLNFS